MPVRPFTPETGAATDSASARVDRHGHQFGCGVDQPDYASPPSFRLVRSCCPSRFGDPKGNILRISSAIGFNPAGGNESRRCYIERCAEVLQARSDYFTKR